MRKIVTLLATLSLVALSIIPAFAADTGPATITAVFTIGSKIYTVNGVAYQMDVAPFIHNGRTLMPIRYLAYSLGLDASDVEYQAKWTFDPTDSAVIVKRARVSGYGLKIEIYYKPDGSASGLLPRGEGGPVVKFDVGPEVLPPGRLMIPYRYVAQALGAIVSWNGATREVTVKTWKTLPAVPSGLTANQVSMQLGGNTVTATENGSQVGQRTYPYPVDIANPYYPGNNEAKRLVAVVPTLEAFGVPSQNVLWDPESQTLAVAGSNPDQFVYVTEGSNTNAANEYAQQIGTSPPYVMIVQKGVPYGDNIVGNIIAASYNVYQAWNTPQYAQAHNGINIEN